MQILPLAKRCYRELSGGQRQRVLLARALCATRKMLFLDEPASGLDPTVTVQMYETLCSLNQKDGISILMISHDLTASLRAASHILAIGDDTFFGTKEAFLSSEQGRRFAEMKGGIAVSAAAGKALFLLGISVRSLRSDRRRFDRAVLVCFGRSSGAQAFLLLSG